ncbi:uncharacterized protein LOC144927721 isoform X4 [Branchiostoma floridae x Branchiostoma belcheri]
MGLQSIGHCSSLSPAEDMHWTSTSHKQYCRETREVRRIPRAERKTRGALMKLCPISPHGRPLLHMQADNLRFSLPWQRTTGGPLRGRLPGHMTHSVIT